MKKDIKELKQITQVREFNNKAINEGKNILVFTLDSGSMFDKPRQRGWVVTSGGSHRFFLSPKEAQDYFCNIA